jgi:hypothetical protein
MTMKIGALKRRISTALPLILCGLLFLHAVWPWVPQPGRAAPTRTIVFCGFSILGDVMNKAIFPAFQEEWLQQTGEHVEFISSFAGSGTITNQLIMGVPAQLRHSLKQIQRQLQVATILVTHDQEEVSELADRIALLDRGRLLEVGPPEELYARPRSLAVASFLGGGTVLAGRVLDRQLALDGQLVPIDGDLRTEEGNWVTMLVRPEHVRLSTEEPRNAHNGPVPAGEQDRPPRRIVLGKGTVIEETFTGSHRRARLRLRKLPATRQLAPAAALGDEGMLVDALLPAADPHNGEELWVTVRDWHLLKGPSPRLLVYDTAHEDAGAVATARMLAEATGADVTVVGIAEGADDEESGRAALQRHVDEQSLPHAEVKIRSGEPAGQIKLEQQETFYELVVLAAPEAASEAEDQPTDPDGLIARLLDRPLTPVLVTRGAPEGFRHLLICARDGEATEDVVRMGGWFAHRLGARVTLLHLSPKGRETHPQCAVIRVRSWPGCMGLVCPARSAPGPVRRWRR